MNVNGVLYSPYHIHLLLYGKKNHKIKSFTEKGRVGADKQTDKPTQTDKQSDRQTDTRTYKRQTKNTYRQTNIHTDKHTEFT